MEKIFVFLICFVPALARSDQALFESECMSSESMFRVVKKFDEKPVLVFESLRPDGKSKNGTLYQSVLFINTKTKSYTLIERTGENVYCVISMGANMARYE